MQCHKMCPSDLQSLWIHVTRNPWHQDVIDRHMYNCVWCIFYTDRITVLVDVWHTLFCTTNNCDCDFMHMYFVRNDEIKMFNQSINNRPLCRYMARATTCQFLIWMRTERQPATRCYHGFYRLNTFLLVNETKNPKRIDCGRSIPATHGR